jgi:hypothetical protein
MERSPRGAVATSPKPAVLLLCAALAALIPSGALAQIKAQLPANITPAWDKGIQPINQDNYWNAVACGKQGGENPPCVFYDTGLCKNDDFTLALFTPYKMVAYEVWGAVRKGQDAPTPSYAEAQRTRVTLGVKPVQGSKNALASVVIKRGGRAVRPVAASGGSFTFDFPAFAPTEDITIDMVGSAATQSCLVEKSVLSRFR